jgi:hypothetical protein
MRRLLHNLGQALPARVVKDLVARVADPSGRHKGERVYYRDLTDKEVQEGEERAGEGAGSAAGTEGGAAE